MLQGSVGELRQTVRSLMRSPGFTCAAIATLALGIGATSAVLGVVRATLLRPLAFSEPERLVLLSTNLPGLGLPRASLSAPLFRDIQEQTRSFESAFAFSRENVTLSGDGTPARLSVVRASAGAVGTLGVTMALGRGFVPEEDVYGGPRVAVIAHHLWQERYGSDLDVLGRRLRLDGEGHTIVGVLPQAVPFPVDAGPTADIWVPTAFAPKEQSRGYHDFMVVARLRPGITRTEAGAELATLVGRLAEQHPGAYNREWSFNADPLAGEAVRDVRGTLLLLQGAVLFVLLIACVNVANLLVARLSFRSREIAVRQTLGASGWSLLRLTLSESLLLALAGGALGLLVAEAITVGIAGLAVESMGPLATGDVDPTALAAHAGLSLLCGLMVGLVPTFQAGTRDLGPHLREGSAGSGQGRRAHRLRSALMVSETALALVMLVGAGLLVRSLGALATIDLGFRPEGVLAVRLSAPASRYGDMGEVDRFFASVLERIRAIAGVENSGAVARLPLSGRVSTTSFVVEGRREASGQTQPHTPFTYAMPGYFETLGIGLVSGRDFTRTDTEIARPVIVVNEAFAKAFWPGREALGQRIAFITDGPPVWREVIGVTRSVRLSTEDRPAEAGFYLPVAQRPFPLDSAFEMNVVVRSALPTESLLAPMRAALGDVDPDQPFYDIRTLEQMMARSIAVRRVARDALSGFALAALAMAAIGIYGVVAFTTGQRRREIGIRVALGARRAEVVGLVLEQGLRLTAVGLAAGVVGSLALSQSLRSLLFGVHSLDPLTYLTTASILGAVAMLACLVPALRATRVDPAVVLHAE